MKWKKFWAAGLILPSLITAGDFVFSEKVSAEVLQVENILSITGIAEVYGDGEKISAAILEYSKNINAKKISAADFQVDGKIIESVSAKKNLVTLKFAYENTSSNGNLNQKPNRQKKIRRAQETPLCVQTENRPI